MHTISKKTHKIPSNILEVFLIEDINNNISNRFNSDELQYIKKQIHDYEKEIILIQNIDKLKIVFKIKSENTLYKLKEKCRVAGEKITSLVNENKYKNLLIIDLTKNSEAAFAFVEGISLGNYQFNKYVSDKSNHSLSSVLIETKNLSDEDIDTLNIISDAVFKCKDFVNEPFNFLNAIEFSEQIIELSKTAGIKTEVLNKKKIETLGMGGLLAVNKGSIDPPVFIIMEWKPTKIKNSKPIVLVGKGIVLDTGGLNIKTGDSMQDMKCDMGGAAAVIGAIYAIAKKNIPVHVIGLIPSTDNRPNGNAFAPGDVIKMYNRKTVEIINTDAEGRMILADALSYATKYNPELVVNIATLTGAASRAIGQYGIVAMQKDADKQFKILKKSGENVYERLVEFPFWDEYGELIKSDIADVKNIGSSVAGMITAGKFLEVFTNYPFIHLDIAGPVFINKKDSYRGKAATGIGVRLIYDFISNIINLKK